jgi:hypothetical protein
MMRLLALMVLLAGAAPASSRALAGDQSPVRAQQDRLDNDLREIEARPNAGPWLGTQAVADSQRLRQRFIALRPLAPRFGPDELRRHGMLAHRSLGWLALASRQFHGDPDVVPSLVGAYSALGDFHGAGGLVSRTGFWFGYAGAHRAARSLALARRGDLGFDRTLEALALTWAAVAFMEARGPWIWPAWDTQTEGLERTIDQAVGGEPLPAPVLIPAVDESALSEADRTRWHEVRNRFPGVSSRAHQAHLALADLRSRLGSRGLSLHPTHVGALLAMEGYLDDALKAIEAREFERALEALVRAEYERGKLRDATGQ